MAGRPLWQKVLFVVVLIAAAWTLAQVFALDVALLMAGDVAAYCEIVAALMFMAATGYLRQSVQVAKLRLTGAARRAFGAGALSRNPDQ